MVESLTNRESSIRIEYKKSNAATFRSKGVFSSMLIKPKINDCLVYFCQRVWNFSHCELVLPIRRVFHQESGQRSGRCSVSWTAPAVSLLSSSPGTEICQITHNKKACVTAALETFTKEKVTTGTHNSFGPDSISSNPHCKSSTSAPVNHFFTGWSPAARGWCQSQVTCCNWWIFWLLPLSYGFNYHNPAASFHTSVRNRHWTSWNSRALRLLCICRTWVISDSKLVYFSPTIAIFEIGYCWYVIPQCCGRLWVKVA